MGVVLLVLLVFGCCVVSVAHSRSRFGSGLVGVCVRVLLGDAEAAGSLPFAASLL